MCSLALVAPLGDGRPSAGRLQAVWFLQELCTPASHTLGCFIELPELQSLYSDNKNFNIALDSIAEIQKNLD